MKYPQLIKSQINGFPISHLRCCMDTTSEKGVFFTGKKEVSGEKLLLFKSMFRCSIGTTLKEWLKMGLIFKFQKGKTGLPKENIQIYNKKGRKWKYLGEFMDVFEILGLMYSKRNCVGVIIKVLKHTTPHLGNFLEDLGRDWRTWYKSEFIPLVNKKILNV